MKFRKSPGGPERPGPMRAAGQPAGRAAAQLGYQQAVPAPARGWQPASAQGDRLRPVHGAASPPAGNGPGAR